MATLRSNFTHVDESLTKLGFTENNKNDIYKILSTILNLGNIQFTSIDGDNCSIENATRGFLSNAATLLNVDVLELECALTSRTMGVGSHEIT